MPVRLQGRPPERLEPHRLRPRRPLLSRRTAGAGRRSRQPRTHPRPHARYPALRGTPRAAGRPPIPIREDLDSPGPDQAAHRVHARRRRLMTLRVVQWTTGNVGKRSVQAVMKRADLELVGCYAWSAEKGGRDVGELCGIEPVGVSATNDIDALLALKPDCVV